MTGLNEFKDALSHLEGNDGKMPALFVGHGSPMNAVEDNEFSRGWAEIGKKLQKPKAILCVSAHWETRGVKVTAMPKPKTIHDFYGFPETLNKKEYPAPGAPDFAKMTKAQIKKAIVELDNDWGLDHGTWSVLAKMYPDADIPTFQLSLDSRQDPAWHYELGKELKALREKGVLILGSGNIVHNLGRINWQSPNTAYDWAVEFDSKMKSFIDKGDHQGVIDYKKLGKAAQYAVPTNEHFLPLLYALAVKDEKDGISYFNENTSLGSISMRSLLIG